MVSTEAGCDNRALSSKVQASTKEQGGEGNDGDTQASLKAQDVAVGLAQMLAWMARLMPAKTDAGEDGIY